MNIIQEADLDLDGALAMQRADERQRAWRRQQRPANDHRERSEISPRQRTAPEPAWD